MNDCVVDASVLAYALIGKTSGAVALRKVLSSRVCHAPHLIDAELGSVLRRRTRAADISSTQALAALRSARDVIDYRYPHSGSLAVLAWTWRDNISFYDALYVALAVRLNLTLITGDRRLGRVAGLPCPIEIIGVD